MTKADTTILAVLALVLVVIIIGPILTIWSLNTLFPALAIPYTIETWAAMAVLGGVFKTSLSFKK